MNVRRPLTVVAGVVASIALAAGPASAHFCYHPDLTPQAIAGMGGSKGYVTFGVLAPEIFDGLCADGVEVLADAAGVSIDTPIHARATMAGGLVEKGRSNKGVSHLDIGAIEAALPDAFAACGDSSA